MSRRRQPRRIPGTPTKPRTVFVLPPIDDDDPAEVKSAIAVRNAASVERTCPACGAVAEFYADRTRPWLGHLVFRHSAECRALTDGEAA